MLRDIGGARVVSHGGSTVGQQSAFEMVPERGFALIALTNARHGSPLNDGHHALGVRGVSGAGRDRGPRQRRCPRAPLTLSADADWRLAPAATWPTPARWRSRVADGRLLGQFSVSPTLAAALLPPGKEWPAEPPFPFELLAGDEYHVTDGPMQGMRGPVLHDADGTTARHRPGPPDAGPSAGVAASQAAPAGGQRISGEDAHRICSTGASSGG